MIALLQLSFDLHPFKVFISLRGKARSNIITSLPTRQDSLAKFSKVGAKNDLGTSANYDHV
jgi:hypothetical protein